MKLAFTVLAVFLFINSIFASQYTATFDSFEGAVGCLSKNVKYIKKVSGDVQVHGQELVLLTTGACGNAIQDNLKSVCNSESVVCE
ncbi:hypothetical protein BCR42DRAFT_421261 [Absidia repens]|uniref:Uncharacterized protein n=1 Tax=Absidia repens TaxID=90262 RepID=A0A1X2I8B6_9FUNG|nr:hypothetical protein BCR42DRAFT_421261 [Absidia repens]